MNKTYAKIGSIPFSTMRPEDLIPAFMDALDSIKDSLMCGSTLDTPAHTQWCKEQVARINATLSEIEHNMNYYGDPETEDPDFDDWGQAYFESEQCVCDTQELEDMLNEFAPPCCYFGASEGDRSDWGFWPCWEIIEDGIHDGNIIEWNMRKQEYPEDEIRERKEAGVLEYVLAISDHGNATLYDTEGNEVWGIA